MARRFRGEFDQTIDGKGRVSVPAPFRRVIEVSDPSWSEGQRPNFVIVYGPESQLYLDCYSMEAIDEVYERIDLMDPSDPDCQGLERLFTAYTADAQVLEDGRIMLPAKFRKKLDLEDKAFFIAVGDHFQLWKPETYQEFEAPKKDKLLNEKGDALLAALPRLPKKKVEG